MQTFTFNQTRWQHYKLCQKRYVEIGDCDPAYPILKYLSHTTGQSNIEDRYWLAFLYSTCYSASTAWAMFRLLPKYKDINETILNNFWKANKSKLAFCTDRAKVKNFDKFVPMLLSYKELMGKCQKCTMHILRGLTPEQTYDNVYKYFGKIYYVGRFSLFLITEVINVLTGYPMIPTGLDLPNAESCKNGLCYALGADNWISKHGEKKSLTKEQYDYLYKMLDRLVTESQVEYPNLNLNYWNVETMLCAYKKYYRKTRYLGFYLDRQLAGLIQMGRNFPELKDDWKLFYKARKELFNHEYLGELHGWTGIRKYKMGLPKKRELKND